MEFIFKNKMKVTQFFYYFDEGEIKFQGRTNDKPITLKEDLAIAVDGITKLLLKHGETSQIVKWAEKERKIIHLELPKSVLVIVADIEGWDLESLNMKILKSKTPNKMNDLLAS
jgi:hypothetical protein